MHFFSWTLFWARWSSMRSGSTLVSGSRTLAVPAVVIWNWLFTYTLGFMEKGGSTKTCTWASLSEQTHSWPVREQRLSYFIVGEVKDWKWFNYIEVLFKVHRYDLTLTVVSVTVFVLALHYYCRFPSHTNSTFALLWIWTCWRLYRACMLWNCRLEVPSTLANICPLCLS